MSTDNLDSLSDEEISELVAVECAGWIRHAAGCVGPHATSLRIPPDFATDANTVLPLLEKHRAWSKGTVGQAVTVYADRLSPAPKPEGVADSEWMIIVPIGNHWNESQPLVPFARAACIALLRAARAEKGAA